MRTQERAMRRPSEVHVNGLGRQLGDWRGRRLIDFLRMDLGLTGTKEGCGEGECGACTVLIDGDPVCSCLVFTDTVVGSQVTTVEGLDLWLLEEMDRLVNRIGGVQCGYCTPGFVVMAQWLVRNPELVAKSGFKKLLEGNLCRCTGYVQLLRAFSGLTGLGSSIANR